MQREAHALLDSSGTAGNRTVSIHLEPHSECRHASAFCL